MKCILISISALFIIIFPIRIHANGHQTINLSVSKAEARPGDTIGYTVSYVNYANRTIEDIVLTFDYDERYLTVVEANGATPSAGVLIYQQSRFASVKPESRTFWFKVRDDLPVGTVSLKAYAKLAGKEMTNVSSEVVTTVVVAQAKLSVSLNVDQNNARPGDLLTFTLTFRNDGDAVAENTMLIFDYDENVTDVVNVSDNTPAGSRTIEWNIGSLFPAQKSGRTVSLRVRPSAAVKQFDTFVKITASNAMPAEQHILTPLLGVNGAVTHAAQGPDSVPPTSKGVVLGASTERAPRTGGNAMTLMFGLSAIAGVTTFLRYRSRIV